jgi:hypothetical protein
VSEREPICEAFDAAVDFFPPQTMPELVYGLVKLTFDIVGDSLIPAKAEPLNHDIRQPDVAYPLAPGSDFWPMKGATDVIVRGDAFAPGGKPIGSQMIRVTVGKRQRLIAVYGDRVIEWPARGQLRFGAPEPYTQMPVVWSNAYGGCDPRVPIDVEQTIAGLSRLELDHPGVYPRNPFGKGYLVIDEPVDGLRLPNLEDPEALLRPESVITGDPRRWYLQPLPACYEFTNYLMFQRYAWLGIQAWYPPPADAPLRELDKHLLPDNWAALARIDPLEHKLPPLALQEGPMGMVFSALAPGTPIIVEGMHPELPHIGFPVPPPPKIQFYIDGKVYPESRVQLSTVLVEPDKARVCLTYVARHFDLPRVFVPGIHKNIPLALLINDQHTVRYDSPPTARELVKQNAGGRPGEPSK